MEVSKESHLQLESHFERGKSPHFQVTDGTVIIMIWRVIQNMRERGDNMTLECIRNEEKLIHLSMNCLERKSMKTVPFSLSEQIAKFIQKVNRVTMETFKDESQEIDMKIFAKAVDLLMLPHVYKYVESARILGQLKVLTFNNLACIYKKKSKFAIALRAVSFALQIQEHLIKEEACGQKYNIITTYLNKAAILSEMKKHEKAIEQIQKSKRFIDRIEKEVVKQMNEVQDSAQRSRLQQKRYYGLYMKMIINYNMGAEKQHMKLIDSAKEYYRQGKQLGIMIENTYMVKKFDAILGKLGEQQRK